MRDFESHIFSPKEIIRSAEREHPLYLPNFDTLTISGDAGTGKTAVANLLGMSIAGTEFILVGEEVRAMYDDLNKIPDPSNLSLDFGQEKRMRVVKGKPVVIEGRLSGVFAADTQISFRDKPKSERPKIVTALITASDEEKMRRLVKRGLSLNPEMAPEQVVEVERKRDRVFVETAQRLYPELLQGNHPYDPNIINRAGEKVYNVVLDSTKDPHPQETAKGFLAILEKRGVIIKIERKNFGEGILGENAYILIKAGSPCRDEGCERTATMTVDSSRIESIHSFPVCSREHAGKIEDLIRERIKKIGINPDEIIIGRNGFPPSTQKDSFGVFTLDLDEISAIDANE